MTKTSIWRALLASLLAAAFLVAMPTAASAQDDVESCAVDIADYEGSAIISISPLTIAPGGTVTITGEGFPPDVSVPLFFNGDEIGAPVTDEDGAFSFLYTVPADATTGTVTFEALCGAFTLTTNLTVTAGQVTPTTIPVTGSDSTGLVQVAAALLAVGALLVFVSRRQVQRRKAFTNV